MLLPHVTLAGVTYSISSKHLGNSHILLNSGICGKLLPARIDYIVQIDIPVDGGTCQVPYIVGRKFQSIELNDDPYQSAPCLQAELWSVSLGELGLYPLSSIDSHFAGLPISWDSMKMMVVISLSRVSNNIYLFISQADFALGFVNTMTASAPYRIQCAKYFLS